MFSMRGAWRRCMGDRLEFVSRSRGAARTRNEEANNMTKRLKDKRCLIIGGSSGIGLAAARRFVAEGARLIVAALHPPPSNDGLDFLPCDATFESSVESMFAESVKRLGGLDVLYHVAGASGRKHGDGALHECTEAGWQATIDLNLKSVFLTNRAAVRQFLNQKSGGTILNMSSVLALAPAPEHF